MPYPAIQARRMPYDIDGTEVGYRGPHDWATPASLIAEGIQGWLSSGEKGNLNSDVRLQSWAIGNTSGVAWWFFFPELREITHMAIENTADQASGNSYLLQGSANTTNGLDGTWETAIATIPTSNVFDADAWRDNIFAVSFSGPVKCVRYARSTGPGGNNASISLIHLYGRKAAGETPDDIIFTDGDGNERTSLTDWEDQPEGTTEISSFKLKNTSTTKIANAVNLQLNHTDFMISLSEDGPWASVIDITSIAANSLSATIYVRNKLGPPLLALGPKQARCIVTVGSWT